MTTKRYKKSNDNYNCEIKLKKILKIINDRCKDDICDDCIYTSEFYQPCVQCIKNKIKEVTND